MTHANPNHVREIIIASRTRDERTLIGEDRLPTIVAISSNYDEARQDLLMLAGVSQCEIELYALLDNSIDVLELAQFLTIITGDLHEVCIYESPIRTLH